MCRRGQRQLEQKKARFAYVRRTGFRRSALWRACSPRPLPGWGRSASSHVAPVDGRCRLAASTNYSADIGQHFPGWPATPCLLGMYSCILCTTEGKAEERRHRGGTLVERTQGGHLACIFRSKCLIGVSGRLWLKEEAKTEQAPWPTAALAVTMP